MPLRFTAGSNRRCKNGRMTLFSASIPMARLPVTPPLRLRDPSRALHPLRFCTYNRTMPFDGLRVLSLESRRGSEMAILVRKQAGDPFIAPSMREVPLEQHEALAFAEALLRGNYDALILTTGVGTRLLWKAILTRHEESELKAAFSRIALVVRGPKPSAALREFGIPGAILVPEPNTWREILNVMRDRSETRVAVQEYGESNTDLLECLSVMNKQVTPVRVYGWDLPEDTGPLREAARRVASRQVDVVLFTTSMQVVNLLRIAAEEGLEQPVREGLARCFIGSIGPTTSETLEEYGFRADFEPSHPKMGLLVNEAADEAARVLAGRR